MVTVDLESEAGGDVIGIDEAGRGPLAGRVYAAAVHVPTALARQLLDGEWSAINDSKKLSAKKRDELERVIKSTQECVWAVASASAQEIDELNILNATHLAMRRAAVQCISGITARWGRGNDEVSLSGRLSILVDGLPVKGLPCPSRSVVKGDAKSLLIAAASILAKTARDADCLRLEAEYPGYGFAKHKGYPTAEHCMALRRLGPCPEHRRSFAPVKECIWQQRLWE